MEEQRVNLSEVARLRALINAEFESAKAGLQGLALGTAQHAFITRRTERIAEYVQELALIASESTMGEVLSQLGM
jgi:hypothetical protein